MERVAQQIRQLDSWYHWKSLGVCKPYITVRIKPIRTEYVCVESWNSA